MKTPLTILLVIVLHLGLQAQHFTHDLGFFVGQTSLQSDYGQRDNFSSQWNNNGLSYSIAHYLSLYNRTLRWDPKNVLHNHLMVKTELHYISNTELTHHGKWAKGNSEAGLKLRSMTGSLQMLSLGINLEYYLKTLEEFVYPYSDISLNPFLTFGFRYSSYTNSLKSELGDWQEDITVLPRKYTLQDALDIGNSQAFSIQLGLGSRFKISPKLDLVTQLTSQYFFSDAIDGLQAQVIENKNNDWLLNIQFGLVYHLNFSTPIFY